MDTLTAVDHLVIAGPDLSALGIWWSEAVGEHAVEGGAHTGRGTRNMLAGIDESTYIELIGPDLEQPEPATARPFGIDALTERRLVTFAIAVTDLDAACASVTAVGIDPGEPIGMERTRPDGVRLQWRLAFPSDPELAGVMPFLIEWGGTAHPAADLSSDVRLSALSLQHPEPSAIEAALQAITRDDWHVDPGPPRVAARLETADGEVVKL